MSGISTSYVTQIDSVDLMNLKYLLMLDQKEEAKIVKCINTYKDPFYSNIFSRVWNAVCSIFGYSDWQQATKLLQPRAYRLIDYDYSGETPKVMQERAKVLSQFIIRFLITQSSVEAKKDQFYIEKSVYEAVVTAPSKAAILERAAYGDGTTLARSPRDAMVTEARLKRNELDETILDVEFTFPRAKEVLAALKKSNEKLTMLDGREFSDLRVTDALYEIYNDRIALACWMENPDEVAKVTMKFFQGAIKQLSINSIDEDVKALLPRCT